MEVKFIKNVGWDLDYGDFECQSEPGLNFVGNREPLRPLLKGSDELSMPQEY